MIEYSKVINKISVKFDWIFLKVIHFDVNSDFNSQFCRRHRLVLRQLPWKSGAVWLSTSKVNNEISVKFDWIFLKVIHFDVNSDVNSQTFSCNFAGNRLVLRQLPCKFCEVFDQCEIWLNICKSYSFRRSDVNSQPFWHFAGVIGWYYGNFPDKLTKFD